MLHDSIETSLFVKFIKNFGYFSKPNDTRIFHSPITGFFRFNEFMIYIDFETNDVVFREQLKLASFSSTMEKEFQIFIPIVSEIQRDDVRSRLCTYCNSADIGFL